MIGAFAIIALTAAQAGVPLPHGFPKKFVGGPLEGLPEELRGEKTRPVPLPMARVITSLFQVGDGQVRSDLPDLITVTAVQSYTSSEYPKYNWSGKIEAGFLKKYAGCAHTAPWLDHGDDRHGSAHFYWSCDSKNPYLTRTNLIFSDGRIDRWEAHDVKPVVILERPANNG